MIAEILKVYNVEENVQVVEQKSKVRKNRKDRKKNHSKKSSLWLLGAPERKKKKIEEINYGWLKNNIDKAFLHQNRLFGKKEWLQPRAWRRDKPRSHSGLRARTEGHL